MKDFTEYLTEQFDDIRILRYKVPAFETLTLKEKIFVYYLHLAALAGRDILWDQNNKYNLRIREVLECIIHNYSGDRSCDEFQVFLIYAKKVFFANGIHHHYSMDKFVPAFSEDYFKSLLENVGVESAYMELHQIIFDPSYMAKRVVTDDSRDMIASSANNYYSGVTAHEVTVFYKTLEEKGDNSVSNGLNSTLVKINGQLVEQVWKIGGKYSGCLEKIVSYLEKAKGYACNSQQIKVIDLLVRYYQTGDLSVFDAYSIEWLREQEGKVDFINGFIEVYGDPLAYKASWESIVQIVDEEACERTRKLSENALWFEKNAPIHENYKKENVSGITARVVQAAILGGDCHPATPIGINLPNAEWIREKYGSKSVTLDNITSAYHVASLNSGVADEFAYSAEEKRLIREYGNIGGNVHTDLHECLGHGSGKMMKGVSTASLKNYYSVIEEARADLFALYYIMDTKLVELDVIPSLDVARCEYDSYIRNGLLVQLTRIKPGDNLEESHMRNRQIIASWVYVHGLPQQVIEKVKEQGKTYFVIQDYQALRLLFGQLLAEIQRIKSAGDYEGAKALVEQYGVKVDSQIHAEVLERYKRLNIPPYAGFINPEYHLIQKDDRIVDVEINYPDDFLTQMLDYASISPV